MSQKVLKEEEIIAFELRGLYQKYGYLPYKMSKFEEYDLYAQNKEFLEGSRIVTFNDTDGKLLALKPDITLSIVKNDVDSGAKRKVYYNENVYRASKKTGEFKELLQVGLECIGDIDLYDEFEALYLAAASLASASQNFVLDISHLGIINSLLRETGCDKSFEKEALRCLAEKNAHELKALCEKYEINEYAEKLIALIDAYGVPEEALQKVEPLCQSEETQKACAKLKDLVNLLSETSYADKIRLDFSVVGGGNYYDDVIFKGFVSGIGESVLSGGRYDRLLTRMGKKSGAIGFAVYLDLLEDLQKNKKTEDVDVLVLYDDEVGVSEVVKTVQMLIENGESVSAQKTTGALRYKRMVDIRGGKKC